MFYYVGKAFVVHGGQEQRNLKPTQLERGYDADRYTYTENGSKNHPGWFGAIRASNKVVTIYANSDSEPRCLVYLLDFYFNQFLKPPMSMDYFYLRPIPKVPADCKNTLGKFMQSMSQDAHIKEKKVNHSLRATGITSTFTAEVPEKLIKAFRDTSPLKLCKCMNNQLQAMSRVLTALPSGCNRGSYLQ